MKTTPEFLQVIEDQKVIAVIEELEQKIAPRRTVLAALSVRNNSSTCRYESKNLKRKSRCSPTPDFSTK